MIALDASALLAFLFGETGHEKVTEVLSDTCLSSVNLCEVLGRFARDGHDPHPIARRLGSLGIEPVSFSEDHAVLAAALRTHTDPLRLSLGDRACLALAQARGIPAMTADRAWQDLHVGVAVRLIR
jgi:PIN domain nuclease of toxin-antitoxin system